jgi:hypothetical protein
MSLLSRRRHKIHRVNEAMAAAHRYPSEYRRRKGRLLQRLAHTSIHTRSLQMLAVRRRRCDIEKVLLVRLQDVDRQVGKL